MTHPAVRIVIGVVAFAALVCGGLELSARHKEAEWVEFVHRWKAKGESFATESHLPAKYPDEERFVSHPWVKAIVAGDPAVLRRLEEMDPENIEGYVAWKESGDATDLPRPMPLELAERVLAKGRDARQDLDAFLEAVSRPGSRLADAAGVESFDFPTWLKHLGHAGNLLSAVSHASITTKNPDEFTRSVDTLLMAGQRLRESNEVLAITLGTVFEGFAYEALRSFPQAGDDLRKGRWLNALERRNRSLQEEFGKVARLERARALAIFKGIPHQSSGGVGSPKNAVIRYGIAKTRLAICEPLQLEVLSSGGNLEVTLKEDRIKDFCRFIREQTKEGDLAESLGSSMISGYCTLYDPLAEHEEKRRLAREWVEGH